MPRLTGIAGIIGTTIQPQPGGNPSSHHPSPPTGNNISQPAISTPVRLHCLLPAPDAREFAPTPHIATRYRGGRGLFHRARGGRRRRAIYLAANKCAARNG